MAKAGDHVPQYHGKGAQSSLMRIFWHIYLSTTTPRDMLYIPATYKRQQRGIGGPWMWRRLRRTRQRGLFGAGGDVIPPRGTFEENLPHLSSYWEDAVGDPRVRIHQCDERHWIVVCRRVIVKPVNGDGSKDLSIFLTTRNAVHLGPHLSASESLLQLHQ